jgi:AcrR family transcriptional regulator
VSEARQRILTKAKNLVGGGASSTVAEIAAAAGVSRTSFYRAFESREALLAELEVTPEPVARDRILLTAVDMVGTHGLAALSMDELAERAGVSRATLYRVFPGKAALFTGLIESYSPLEPVSRLLAAKHDAAPGELMPELARTAYRAVYSGGENRAGLVRALFFEVSGLAPETEEAAREAITRVVGALVMYLMSQMSAGRLRRMHPLLALQSFIGPILFHILTRPLAERVLSLDVDGEIAVTQLAESWLRAMVVKENGDE